MKRHMFRLSQGHVHLINITLRASVLSDLLGVFYWENDFSLCQVFLH